MKLLLTSSGLTNPTITAALEELVGKSIGESRVVYVPTAMNAVPDGVEYAWQALEQARPSEWESFGILELTALPDLPPDLWMPALRSADVIMVGGGNTPYLSHWFQRSGFSEALPSLLQSAVYVGASAGSMVVSSGFHLNAERLSRDGIYDDDLYGDVAPLGAGSDETLRLVNFQIRPHLQSPDFDNLTLERIVETVTEPTYVLDDDSAVVVDGPIVRVASEGEWHYLTGAVRGR